MFFTMIISLNVIKTKSVINKYKVILKLEYGNDEISINVLSFHADGGTRSPYLGMLYIVTHPPINKALFLSTFIYCIRRHIDKRNDLFLL